MPHISAKVDDTIKQAITLRRTRDGGRKVLSESDVVRELLGLALSGGGVPFAPPALVDVYPAVARNRYAAPHAPYLLRELRIAAYAQFLQSYKSVTVAGMARAFGVTPPFLDAELARFIAAGRLPAKVDAVNGAVETTRPDSKNAQYHALLKSGDLLLNKVQKLARVGTS